LSALLGGGDWLTAVNRGRSLLAGPSGKAAAADTGLMDLLIRAADIGLEDKTLAAWLAMVDEQKRTRLMWLVSARLALRGGKGAEARDALDRLIAAGRTDPAVFVWAGHLAETQEDWPKAQTLYEQAGKLKGPSARLAGLYLARLHLRRGRLAKAAQLLRQYLDAYPQDASARSLLALVEARRRSAKEQ